MAFVIVCGLFALAGLAIGAAAGKKK